MRIEETKVYQFSELSDEAKETAIAKLCDINVDYEWWDYIFDDAKQIGLKIGEFGVDWKNYCRGNIDDTKETANKIIKEHGKNCETHKTAVEYLNHITENEDEQEKLDLEFKYSILEDYRIILQKEYEYLTSEEAIIETIEANEYEFNEDGKLI